MRAGASHTIPISDTDSTKQVVIGTENEWRSKDLTVVERYRPVEFDRDWNLAGVMQDGDQVLASASVGLLNGKSGRVALTSSLFHIDGRYDGFRQALTGPHWVATPQTDAAGLAGRLKPYLGGTVFQ